MKIELLAVDRLRAGWARTAVGDYLSRLARHVPASRREVKPAAGDDAAAVRTEGERLLDAASRGPRDRLVAVDRRGEPLTSEGWARALAGWANEGVGRIVFVVGGAGGLSDEVLAAADRVVGLGPQTMAHELAQVVLAEQLYRGWSIVRGEPYHK